MILPNKSVWSGLPKRSVWIGGALGVGELGVGLFPSSFCRLAACLSHSSQEALGVDCSCQSRYLAPSFSATG